VWSGGDAWRGKRNSISENLPSLASPDSLIVANVPKNQSCSPSPECDQVAVVLTPPAYLCAISGL